MKTTTERPTKPGWYWLKDPLYGPMPIKVYEYVSQGYEHPKGFTALMCKTPFRPAVAVDSDYFNTCIWSEEPIEEMDL